MMKTVKEIFRANKGKIILSSLAVLLPILIGALLNAFMPQENNAATMSGGAIVLTASIVCAFLFLLNLVCLFVTEANNKEFQQTKKAASLVYFIFPIISLLTCGCIYAAFFGADVSVMRTIVCGGMGLMFMLIGNYLPKVKPNAALGIKVKWALENSENWAATHRFGGKVWFIAGAFMVLCAFLPTQIGVAVMGVIVLFVVAASYLYSYLYHVKQVKTGTAAADTNIKSGSKAMGKISAVATPLVLIAVAVLMFTGGVTVSFNDDDFEIKATYWPASTVSYADVESAEYTEAPNVGTRVTGFGSARLQLGAYQSGTLGRYTSYAYTACAPRVIITTKDGRTFVVNGKDEAATRELYNSLEGHLSVV